MTDHSLSIVPGFPGNYNWDNFRRGQEVLKKDPWHQFVDIRVAQDIKVKVNQLREAGIKAAAIGVEINAADLDETLRLMKPEEIYDKKGKRIHFMDLWKKQSEEEVSLKVSFNPTRKELVSMTEELLKIYYDCTAKEEESEEEDNQSIYFDAH